MATEGLLTLRTDLRQGKLVNLDVALRRPAVTTLFLGRLPQEVIKHVVHLYALCAQAQRAAAQLALDFACARAPEPACNSALWLEMLHENLWRLLLDWPPAMGLVAQKEAFVAWRAACHGANCVAQTEALLAGPLEVLRLRCQEVFPGCSDPCGFQLPALAPAQCLEFWQHQTRGFSPAQTAAPSVPAAVLARISQVAVALRGLACDSPYPLAGAGANGWGVGQVLTARGVLTHAVQVDDGRVKAYHVCAPTDVFFADNQALTALLPMHALDSPLEARKALELAVLALDPCLPFVVELRHA
jgi:hypothetical protein